MDIFKHYDALWSAFIRPYRQTYSDYDLGPNTFITSNSQPIRRVDISLHSTRNNLLKCSHYQILDQNTLQPIPAPCVVYLHSQTGSKLEAKPCLDVLLPLNISVFTFDFSGCGLSGGEYVTLGYYEKEDVEVVIRYLRNTLLVSKIGLWGRSMGAVACLLYAEKDPNLSCIVVDSPFCNLNKLAEDVAISKTNLPGFVIKGALTFVKSTILKKTKFNMNSLNPEKIVDKCLSPCLFAGSKLDSFVRFWHVETLLKLYKGPKSLSEFSAEHNEARPEYILNEIACFFVKHLITIPENTKNNNIMVSNEKLSTMAKEYSPYISKDNKNFVSFMNKSERKNEKNEMNNKIVYASYDKPCRSKQDQDEDIDFMSTFSHSLKKLNEKDFLSIFKGKVAESLNGEERERSITHDGVFESNQLMEKFKMNKKDINPNLNGIKNVCENSKLIKEIPITSLEKDYMQPTTMKLSMTEASLYEIPNERYERSISVLDDYTNFFGKDGLITQKYKANNFNIMKHKDSYPLQECFIDNVDDENNPNIEGHLKIISPHKDITNGGARFKTGSISTKPVFKGNFTKKLQNVKVINKKKTVAVVNI